MTEAYLMHHGIKGMKWGIRRYQNADGSLTSAGLRRYGQGNKLGNTGMTIVPATAGQMRRDVRKMRKNMIKDTLRGTFSKKTDLRRRDVAPANLILPGSGAVIRSADKFSKQGFKDAMSRNKQVAANYKNYMNSTYGDTYRKAKKRQIVKAATAAGALALIGGAAIAANAKKSSTGTSYTPTPSASQQARAERRAEKERVKNIKKVWGNQLIK